MGHVPRGSTSRVERIFPTLLIANCSSLSGKFGQSRFISQDYSVSSRERERERQRLLQRKDAQLVYLYFYGCMPHATCLVAGVGLLNAHKTGACACQQFRVLD